MSLQQCTSCWTTRVYTHSLLHMSRSRQLMPDGCACYPKHSKHGLPCTSTIMHNTPLDAANTINTLCAITALTTDPTTCQQEMGLPLHPELHRHCTMHQGGGAIVQGGGAIVQTHPDADHGALRCTGQEWLGLGPAASTGNQAFFHYSRKH